MKEVGAIGIFVALLQVALIVLKIMGVIINPWLIVFLPAIIYFGARIVFTLTLVTICIVLSGRK